MAVLVDSQEDAMELTHIYWVASTGFKFKQLGKDAYKRMKKGDFTNTPKNQKENKKKKS